MINTFEIQPPGTIRPRLHRVGIRFGTPLDFSRYEGMEDDRFVLRSATDEVMYELMSLSGQEYVDMYATRAKELIAEGGMADSQASSIALMLLALGLGAGLSNAEIVEVRSCHLHVDDEGALIEVVGNRPRVVPVLALWEQPLLDYAQARPLSPQQYLFRPLRTTVDDHTIGNFVDKTRPGHVKPTAQRMRVTWIVTHLIAGTPLKPLIDAAGVDSLEALTRYLKFIPGKDLSDVRAQFRSANTGTDPS